MAALPTVFLDLTVTLGDAIVGIGTIALAVGTFLLARQTKKQAEASVKMAREMAEHRYSESSPLLIPEINPSITQGADPAVVLYMNLQTGVHVTWSNLGKGVAVNARFSVWGTPLDSHPGKVLLYEPQESKTVAIGTGKQEQIRFGAKTWSGKWFDRPQSYVPRLVAEYLDIYERKFSSIQEFRMDEQNRTAYLGDLYFEINGRRMGEEVSRHDS